MATNSHPNDQVWLVKVKNKSLGQEHGLSGKARLSLVQKELILSKQGSKSGSDPQTHRFPLISIRRCGHTSTKRRPYFFLELGRSSELGAGELWLKTEDSNTAGLIHEVVLAAMMSSKSKEEIGTFTRPRSSSTSEKAQSQGVPAPPRAPRPASDILGSPTSPCSSLPSLPPIVNSNPSANYFHVLSYSLSGVGGRERCDSISSNPATSNTNYEAQLSSPSSCGDVIGENYVPMEHSGNSSRPVTISEEEVNDNYLDMSTTSSPTASPVGIQSPKSLSFDSFSLTRARARDRCDSMPSRTRTVKESSITSPCSSEDIGNNYLPMEPAFSFKALNKEKETDDYYMEMSIGKSGEDIRDKEEDYYIEISVGKSSKNDPRPLLSSMMTNLNSAQHKLSSPSSSTGTPTKDDDYLSMEPKSIIGSSCEIASNNKDDYYLDMSTLSSSLPKGSKFLPGSSGPATTNCPLPTGPRNKPQTYKLDKVKSFFSPTEEESFDFIKPVRAYSIGSRPQIKSPNSGSNSNLSRTSIASNVSGVSPASYINTGLANVLEESNAMRIRAYSMGHASRGRGRGPRPYSLRKTSFSLNKEIS